MKMIARFIKDNRKLVFLFTLIWFIFWFIIAPLSVSVIWGDISATYVFTGVFSYPVSLPLCLYISRYVVRKGYKFHNWWTSVLVPACFSPVWYFIGNTIFEVYRKL